MQRNKLNCYLLNWWLSGIKKKPNETKMNLNKLAVRLTGVFFVFLLGIFVLSGCSKGERSVKEGLENYFAGLSAENDYIISPKEFVKLLEDDPSKVYILDIRKQEDYDRAHIPGAKHCWWFDVDGIIPELPRDKTIVVCCYTGQSAGQIVGVLRMAGYDAVSLQGGWVNGWQPYYTSRTPVFLGGT